MKLKPDKIGDLVERLFPEGFAREGYFCIFHAENSEYRNDKVLKVIQDGDLEINYERAGLNEENLSIFRSKEELLKEYIRDRKPSIASSINSKYLLPPYSPFDLFALSSVLLLRSGAYHHIEVDVRPYSAKNVRTTRESQRVVRIDQRDRDIWSRASEIWMKYPYFSHKESVGNAEEIENLLEERARIFSSESKIAIFEKYYMDLWWAVLRNWKQPVHRFFQEDSEPPKWWLPVYKLFALSDETALGTGYSFNRSDGFKGNEWPLLANYITNIGQSAVGEEGEDQNYIASISIANRSIVNVLPKSRVAPLGCTLRSLSLNLSSLPGVGTIRGGWFWTDRGAGREVDKPPFNIVLIPYPYKVKSTQFRPTSEVVSSDAIWGVFQINAPYESNNGLLRHIDEVIIAAKDRVNQVHAIVLPELSVTYKTVKDLIDKCENDPNYNNIELLCVGMREHSVASKGSLFPANGAHVVTFKDDQQKKSERRVAQHLVFHEKHHRWRLTEDQIRQYSLSPSLHPARIWWEDLRIINRKLPFFVLRESWTATALICEDLARNDPARDIVEAVGPNLVISLLMDGPQVPNRWSARYASVLAEDPGSSVLSMSSLGLIQRSNEYMENEHGKKGSDAIALWRDDIGDLQEINLGLDAYKKFNDAVVISLTEYPSVQHSMDGRVRKKNSISLRLTGQRKISVDYSGKHDFKKTWNA